eukprot:s909_g17.t1
MTFGFLEWIALGRSTTNQRNLLPASRGRCWSSAKDGASPTQLREMMEMSRKPVQSGIQLGFQFNVHPESYIFRNCLLTPFSTFPIPGCFRDSRGENGMVTAWDAHRSDISLLQVTW